MSPSKSKTVLVIYRGQQDAIRLGDKDYAKDGPAFEIDRDVYEQLVQDSSIQLDEVPRSDLPDDAEPDRVTDTRPPVEGFIGETGGGD